MNYSAAGDDRRLAGDDICGGNRQRDPQFLVCLATENLAQEDRHLVIAEKAKAGEGPAGKILEPHQAGDLFQYLGGNAAGVTCSNHRADAGTGNEVDWDLFFFEYFKDADMGKAAGKTSAQRNTESGSVTYFSSGNGLRLALKFAPEGADRADDTIQRIHVGTGTPELRASIALTA